ncbi:MAG: DUF3293 domain-containing protein, partial [Acetobacteraceae bacterium]|nr:DUF3293 domain-containing protein [Acetobacteraceae bacterium]
YRAGQAGGRVGRRAPALEALLRGWGAREAAFLTAWNPWGRPRGDAANARAHARLLGETRRLRRATGWCGTREWRELTLLLAADPRRIATLARRHRQAAVVHLRLGCALRLAYSPRFASKPRPAAR